MTFIFELRPNILNYLNPIFSSKTNPKFIFSVILAMKFIIEAKQIYFSKTKHVFSSSDYLFFEENIFNL